MRGQPYVKSPIDMACWDVVGRAAGKPLCEVLGARFGSAVPLYDVVTVLPLDDAVALARALVADGYRRIQVKVGTTPEVDAERLAAVRAAVGTTSCSTPMRTAPSRAPRGRFLRATRELEYVLEQPCRTYAECASVRRAADRPLVLDESIVTLDDLLRAQREGVVDGITSSCSGSAASRGRVLIRDVAVELGVEVTVEDAGGASLVTAADRARRSRHRRAASRSHVRFPHVGRPPITARACRPGRTAPSGLRPGAGLGIDVDVEALGEPFVDVGRVTARGAVGEPAAGRTMKPRNGGASRRRTAPERRSLTYRSLENPFPPLEILSAGPGRPPSRGGAHAPRRSRGSACSCPEARDYFRAARCATSTRSRSSSPSSAELVEQRDRLGTVVVRADRPVARAHRHARRTPPRRRFPSAARPPSVTSTAASARGTSPTSAISSA